MCGDFNGTIRGSVSRFLKSQGFYSAFEACGAARPPPDGPSRWISHLNHHGECVGVDHIWVLNPSKQSAQTGIGAPPPSWKTAIYAMIQAKMLERGLATNDGAFAFFDVDESLGITRDEFETAVRMLDLTGEGSPGLLRGEIETLYDDCDKDGDGLVDFGEFIRKLGVESMERAYRAIRRNNGIEEGPWDVVGDLMATAASPTVLAGFTVDEDEDEDEEGFGGFEEAMAIAASRRDLGRLARRCQTRWRRDDGPRRTSSISPTTVRSPRRSRREEMLASPRRRSSSRERRNPRLSLSFSS